MTFANNSVNGINTSERDYGMTLSLEMTKVDAITIATTYVSFDLTYYIDLNGNVSTAF